jgi:hypothetical protein
MKQLQAYFRIEHLMVDGKVLSEELKKRLA